MPSPRSLYTTQPGHYLVCLVIAGMFQKGWQKHTAGAARQEVDQRRAPFSRSRRWNALFPSVLFTYSHHFQHQSEIETR